MSRVKKKRTAGRPRERELTALGRRINDRRNAINIGVRELAERSGLPLRTLYAIACEEQQQLARLAAIAKALGCTVGELLGEGKPCDTP